jgi:hypothetical protein
LPYRFGGAPAVAAAAGCSLAFVKKVVIVNVPVTDVPGVT